MTETKLLRWALHYHELGWPVVPISEDKKPLIKWKEYQKEEQTIEMIEMWWEQWPTAGIAIITGEISGLIVVDCDTEEAAEAVLAADIYSPITAVTRRGRHLFFRHPGHRVKNAANWKGMKNVDLRGDGGLVKVYPSTNYKWDLAPGVNVSDIPFELPLFEFDDAEVESDPLDLSTTNVVAIHDGIIPTGERNDGMTRVVGKLITDDPTLWGKDLLIQAWAENQKRCQPPLEKEEMLTIVNSVASMHRDNNPEEFNADGERIAALMTDQEREVRKRLEMMSYWDAIGYCGEPPEREWLVDKMIPAGLPGVLASGGGVGKTFMLLDLAYRVAYGYDDEDHFFMGHRIRKHGEVVLFLAEDDHDEISRRMETIDPGYRRVFHSDNMSIIPIPELDQAISFGGRKFDSLVLTDEARYWADALACKENLALVVIDPLQSFFEWRFDEDNVAADRALKWAQSIAVRTGATVVFTHHLRKEEMGTAPTTPQGAIAKIRGASNVVNSSRFAIPIWRPTEEAAQEVADRLGLVDVNNAIFMAGLGKENFGGDVSTHWMVRNPETGMLEDRTDELEGMTNEKREKLDTKDIINQMLIDSGGRSIGSAAIADQLGMGRSQVNKILKELKDSRRIYPAERNTYMHFRNHAHFEDVTLKLIDKSSNGMKLADLSKTLAGRERDMFREAIRVLVEEGHFELYDGPKQANGKAAKLVRMLSTLDSPEWTGSADASD